MEPVNTTLKDIARELGVSATTVHRALSGSGRVSEQTRKRVAQLAREKGYRSNYVASSLKRKNLRIAIALPEPVEENRYYYLAIWKGIRNYLDTVQGFNVQSLEFSYPLTPAGNGMALKEIYERHANEIDGLLTIPNDHAQSSFFMEKLAESGVPIVTIGMDSHKKSRFCCVKSRNDIAGQLAAEMLTAYHPPDMKKKIMVTGDQIGSLNMPDQYKNSSGFERYIEQNAPNATLLRAYNPNTGQAFLQMKELLIENPDAYAIYSCSARHTIQMCKAVAEAGMTGKVKLIGNDCFEESYQLLSEGVLTAIIDKKILRQGSLAMETLFNYVVKSEYPSSGVLYVRPSIVMRSNLNEEGWFNQE